MVIDLKILKKLIIIMALELARFYLVIFFFELAIFYFFFRKDW